MTIPTINIFKELKETISKELKESLTMSSDQISKSPKIDFLKKKEINSRIEICNQ